MELLNDTFESSYTRDSVIDYSYELVFEIKNDIIKNITKENNINYTTKETINGFEYKELIDNELTYGLVFMFQVLTILFILYVLCIFISLPYHVFIARRRGHCI